MSATVRAKTILKLTTGRMHLDATFVAGTPAWRCIQEVVYLLSDDEITEMQAFMEQVKTDRTGGVV